jgi:hypothetical protein
MSESCATNSKSKPAQPTTPARKLTLKSPWAGSLHWASRMSWAQEHHSTQPRRRLGKGLTLAGMNHRQTTTSTKSNAIERRYENPDSGKLVEHCVDGEPLAQARTLA